MEQGRGNGGEGGAVSNSARARVGEKGEVAIEGRTDKRRHSVERPTHVGAPVGAVGCVEGAAVGLIVGDSDGSAVGWRDGASVGKTVGANDGSAVG